MQQLERKCEKKCAQTVARLFRSKKDEKTDSKQKRSITAHRTYQSAFNWYRHS